MKIEFGNGYTLQDWGTAWGDGDQDRLIALAAGPIGGMGLTTRQGDLLMTLSWLRSLSARVVIPELHRSCFFLGQFTGTLPRRVAPWSSIRPRVDHVYPAPLEVAHVPRHN